MITAHRFCDISMIVLNILIGASLHEVKILTSIFYQVTEFLGMTGSYEKNILLLKIWYLEFTNCVTLSTTENKTQELYYYKYRVHWRIFNEVQKNQLKIAHKPINYNNKCLGKLCPKHDAKEQAGVVYKVQ